MKLLSLFLAIAGLAASDAFVAPGKHLQSTTTTTSSAFFAPSLFMGRRRGNRSTSLSATAGTDICPLLDPPADPAATFEAAMG